MVHLKGSSGMKWNKGEATPLRFFGQIKFSDIDVLLFLNIWNSHLDNKWLSWGRGHIAAGHQRTGTFFIMCSEAVVGKLRVGGHMRPVQLFNPAR